MRNRAFARHPYPPPPQMVEIRGGALKMILCIKSRVYWVYYNAAVLTPRLVLLLPCTIEVLASSKKSSLR